MENNIIPNSSSTAAEDHDQIPPFVMKPLLESCSRRSSGNWNCSEIIAEAIHETADQKKNKKQQQQSTLAMPSGSRGSSSPLTPHSARSNDGRKRQDNFKTKWYSKGEFTSTLYTHGEEYWRKYGEKKIKGFKFNRNYYRCGNKDCQAKRIVQQQNGEEFPPVYYVTNLGLHTCKTALAGHDQLMVNFTPNKPFLLHLDPTTSDAIKQDGYSFTNAKSSPDQEPPYGDADCLQALINTETHGYRSGGTHVSLCSGKDQLQMQEGLNQMETSLFHLESSTTSMKTIQYNDLCFTSGEGESSSFLQIKVLDNMNSEDSFWLPHPISYDDQIQQDRNILSNFSTTGNEDYVGGSTIDQMDNIFSVVDGQMQQLDFDHSISYIKNDFQQDCMKF